MSVVHWRISFTERPSFTAACQPCRCTQDNLTPLKTSPPEEERLYQDVARFFVAFCTNIGAVNGNELGDQDENTGVTAHITEVEPWHLKWTSTLQQTIAVDFCKVIKSVEVSKRAWWLTGENQLASFDGLRQRQSHQQGPVQAVHLRLVLHVHGQLHRATLHAEADGPPKPNHSYVPGHGAGGVEGRGEPGGADSFELRLRPWKVQRIEHAPDQAFKAACTSRWRALLARRTGMTLKVPRWTCPLSGTAGRPCISVFLVPFL
mmetsp:Transcript_130848/g.419635  ORF Transcript_130848/g.419635 Transcript_130848/m.419635 type:complete len:262 (+) Transcript_130848:2102-2887(+)